MADSTNSKKAPIIKCPHCGAEYLPADLFMPGELIGKPIDVVRDGTGKIVYHDYEDGYSPATSARYCCDECGKSFVVEPIITYKVRKEDEATDFSDLSASLLD